MLFRSLGRFGLQGDGREDRDPEFESQLLHRPRGNRTTPARGPVRLRQHRYGPMAEIRQALEGGHRESRRPRKDHAPVQIRGARSREALSGDTPASPSRRRLFSARFFKRWRFNSER